MNKLIPLLAFSVLLLVPAGVQNAFAAPYDPNSFTSLGPLPAGNISIDTDTLTVTGVGGNGVVGPNGEAIFTFDGGSTSSGIITVTGNRPLVLLFQGDFTFSGVIDISGGNAAGTVGGIGIAGGANGGSHGATGSGAGGGGAGASSANDGGGGSGGSFGGTGGSCGGTPGCFPPGTTYGDLSVLLEAGSGGGGGGDRTGGFGSGAGAGGGALEIAALTTLDLGGVTILANGGDGVDVPTFATGEGAGGSGGAVFLHGFNILLDGSSSLSTKGGDGAFPGFGHSAGCGGGGRILILTNTNGQFVNTGVNNIDVSEGNQMNCPVLDPGTGANLSEGILEILSDLDIGDPGGNGEEPSQVIGGEIIPIESTSLILANTQSFSWMIPVVLSILGIGLVLVRRK